MNDRISKPVHGIRSTTGNSYILRVQHLIGSRPGFVTALLTAALMVFTLVMAGCGSEQTVNNEASTSAIRAAEEVGASSVPSASLYLQLAKEELENAKGLAKEGEKEKAESMLLRAQADGELAVALSRGDADKTAAADAIERVRQLRIENKLPHDGK